MFSRFTRIAPGLRVVAKVGLAASFGAVSIATCDFDVKGFPKFLDPPDGKTAPLVLAGVGMRRKNLYIMEVDVYQVGFYLEKDYALSGK